MVHLREENEQQKERLKERLKEKLKERVKEWAVERRGLIKLAVAVEEPRLYLTKKRNRPLKLIVSIGLSVCRRLRRMCKTRHPM